MTARRNITYRRTEQSLFQGYLSLLESKTPEKITVSELIEYAQIDTKTFYNHYPLSIESFKQSFNEKIIEWFLQLIKAQSTSALSLTTDPGIPRAVAFWSSTDMRHRTNLLHSPELICLLDQIQHALVNEYCSLYAAKSEDQLYTIRARIRAICGGIMELVYHISTSEPSLEDLHACVAEIGEMFFLLHRIIYDPEHVWGAS